MQYKEFIPLDKSWIIRIGVLDMIYGYREINRFLDVQTDLADDLLALKRACVLWNTDASIDVGESATLLRYLRFASWKFGLNKGFIKKGTLKRRRISNNPRLIHRSQRDLLKRIEDESAPTTQWASAAVLLGDEDRLPNAPYKLQLTYEAVEHWRRQREQGKPWDAKYDETIKVQAETFLRMLRGERPPFLALQAEDYCFARIFGYMTREDGEQWPNLIGHESNRLEEIEQVIARANAGEQIDSSDHRVIQAIVMWGIINGKAVKIRYPNAVRKSWSRFWDFIQWQYDQQ